MKPVDNQIDYADVTSDGFATVQGTPLTDEEIKQMFPVATKEQVAMLRWNSGMFKPGEIIMRQDLKISTFRLFSIAEGEVEAVLFGEDKKTVVMKLDSAKASKGNGQHFLLPMEVKISPYALRAVTLSKVIRISGPLVDGLLNNQQARENALAHTRKIFRGLTDEYEMRVGKSGYALIPYFVQLVEVVKANPDLGDRILEKMETFCEWAVKYDPNMPHKERKDNHESLAIVQGVFGRLINSLIAKRRSPKKL